MAKKKTKVTHGETYDHFFEKDIAKNDPKLKQFYTKKTKYHQARKDRALGFKKDDKKEFSKGYLDGLDYRYENFKYDDHKELNYKLNSAKRKIGNQPKGSIEESYLKGYIASMYDQKKQLTKKANK
jgi:hypothetical protein